MGHPRSPKPFGRPAPARFVLGPSGGNGAFTRRPFGRARYLEELEWRFNNRDNPYLFPDTLRRIMRTAPPEYRMLVASRLKKDGGESNPA